MSSILGPRTMAERVADQLRNEIQQGELAPGARLLQNEIAARLGVSTTPVREAFQVLQAEGLVVIDRHRGAVVYHPTKDDLRECFEIREMLEPYATARAVANLGEKDFDELQGLIDEMRSTRQRSRWVDLNNRFHLTLYAASGMPRLCRVIETLRDASGAYLHMFAAARIEAREHNSVERETEHQQILDACRRGDVGAASDATRDHLWQAVHDLLQTEMNDDDPWHVRIRRQVRQITERAAKPDVTSRKGTSMEPEKTESTDGTPIAYWRSGTGPELVLVHGITSTHSTFDEIEPHLSPERTVTIYDRRGRGRSGDRPGDYSVDREVEDLLAVLGAADAYPVDVFAHSFAAYIALGAARRHPELIRSIVLYSPGFGDSYPEPTLRAIESAITEGDPDGGLTVLLTDIIGMPADEVEFMKGSAAWRDRIDSAHTVVRECRADETAEQEIDGFAEVDCPVLVVSGATNPANKRAVAERFAGVLPRGRLHLLEGHGHAAHHTAPAELARLVVDFTG